MKPKNQRLVLVAAAIAAVLSRSCWRCGGCKDRASYFYTPADIAAGKAAEGTGDAARRDGRDGLGPRAADGVTIRFVVTDGKARDPGPLSRHRARTCSAKAAAPSPKGGCRAGTFVADTILAKHDERYMPPELGNLAAEHKAGKTLEK